VARKNDERFPKKNTLRQARRERRDWKAEAEMTGWYGPRQQKQEQGTGGDGLETGMNGKLLKKSMTHPGGSNQL
jgi:hypothetical protein